MTRLEFIKETGDAATAMHELGKRLSEAVDDCFVSENEPFNKINLALIEHEANERFSVSNVDIETDEDGNITAEAVSEFLIESAAIYVAACIKVLCGQTILDYLNEEVE